VETHDTRHTHARTHKHAPTSCETNPSQSVLFIRYTAWTRYTALGGPDWGYVLGRELYNHKEDPGENVNIVQSRAPKVANVRSQMHEWLEAHVSERW